MGYAGEMERIAAVRDESEAADAERRSGSLTPHDDRRAEAERSSHIVCFHWVLGDILRSQ